ncbi:MULTISPECIES: GAF domain-containing sensor histidine kinase [Anaerolinea]|uniref:GAF domain-containing sensor histidine kinase n=1 Tax=Anaerolinea TaxID=233189 RepID=UPI00261479E4|nr:GAF domain-containing sensor histidine kinase [Anaerolinea thermophila]
MSTIEQISLGSLIIASTLLFILWTKIEKRKERITKVFYLFSPILLMGLLEIFSEYLNGEILSSIPPFLFFWSALAIVRLSRYAYPRYHENVFWYLAGYLTGIVLLLFYTASLKGVIALPPLLPQAIIILLWVLPFLLLGVSFVYLATLYKKNPTALYRNRILFWFAVNLLFGLSIPCFLLNYPLLSIVFLTLTFTCVIYIQWRTDLPDLILLVRRGLSLVLETLVVYLLFTLALGFFLLISLNSGLSQIIVILLGGGLLFSVLIYPLIGTTRKYIRRRLWQSKKNYTSLLSNYSRTIASLSNLETLFNHLSELLHQTFSIDHILLLTASDKEDTIEFQNNLNPLSTPLIVSKQSPFLIHLQEHKSPILQYVLDFSDIFAEVPEEEKNTIRSYKGDVIIPILFQSEWLGLLIIGAKPSGDRFFEEEILFLQAIADQTAVALKNALLYEDLLKRNRENERLNLELTLANKELSRLDKAKTDFINIASHELRTPLTQIMGFNDFLGEMLQSGPLPQSSLEHMVGGIKKAARRLEEIIGIMLDISKLETQIFEIHPTPVKPATIIRAAVDKWRNALDERNLTLHVADLSNLPLIQADSQRMVQVFSELLQNAIKSTPDHREIFITGKTIQDPVSQQTFVQITVADTGIGIAPEDTEKIFEKFYRIGDVLLHSTGDIKFKGAGPGLGLTIAKGIVEAHHGRIWAESAGRDETSLPGSKFHVLLPAVQTSPQEN